MLASGERVGLLLLYFRNKCYENRICLRAYYAGWKVKTLDFQVHLQLVNDKSGMQRTAQQNCEKANHLSAIADKPAKHCLKLMWTFVPHHGVLTGGKNYVDLYDFVDRADFDSGGCIAYLGSQS